MNRWTVFTLSLFHLCAFAIIPLKGEKRFFFLSFFIIYSGCQRKLIFRWLMSFFFLWWWGDDWLYYFENLFEVFNNLLFLIRCVFDLLVDFQFSKFDLVRCECDLYNNEVREQDTFPFKWNEILWINFINWFLIKEIWRTLFDQFKSQLIKTMQWFEEI